MRDSEVIFSRNDLKFTEYIVQYVYVYICKIKMFKYTQVIAWWLHIYYCIFKNIAQDIANSNSRKSINNCGADKQMRGFWWEGRGITIMI